MTGTMQKNIESALKNTDRIEDIDEKAVVLADSAKQFKNSAGAAKRMMRCRYWKMVSLSAAREASGRKTSRRFHLSGEWFVQHRCALLLPTPRVAQILLFSGLIIIILVAIIVPLVQQSK